MHEDRPVLSATTLQARRIGAILASFRVARVCQRYMGFLVLIFFYGVSASSVGSAVCGFWSCFFLSFGFGVFDSISCCCMRDVTTV